MKTISVSTAEDVAALAKDVRTGKRRHMGDIRIRLNGLDERQAAHLSNEINKHYFSCGCNEATALGLVGLAVAVIWSVTSLDSWQNFSWRDGLIVAGVFILTTGIGKAIGRWRARSALKSLVDKLVSYEPGALDIGKCDGSALCSVGE